MSKKIKVTYIFTHHIRWVAYEWLALHLDRTKFEVDFLILNKEDPMVDFLKQENIPYKTTTFQDYANTPEVVKFIYDHLVENQTDVVHTYFFAGHITGIQAAFYANVPVRVFTRQHGGIQYKRHAPSKFKLLWNMASDAVAVTNWGKQKMIADGVPEHKISVIPNGYDLREFENVSAQRIQALRDKYIGDHKGPVIGVAARYVDWKGVKYIVEAFQTILKAQPDALLVLAGTHFDTSSLKKEEGEKQENSTYAPNLEYPMLVHQLLAQLPASSYREIYFEDDLFALFRLFDIFVHVPTGLDREAFGQVYIDAMLSRVPSVISLSGIVVDFGKHKENAWVVDYQNSPQIAEGVLALLEDKELREKIAENAYKEAANYSLENQLLRLEELYIEGVNNHKVKHQADACFYSKQ